MNHLQLALRASMHFIIGGALIGTAERSAPGAGRRRSAGICLAVALASPVVQPRSAEWVCTAAGFVDIDLAAKATETAPVLPGSGGADCPMCLVPGLAPSENKAAVRVQARPLGRSLESIPAARLAAATASPLPARGQPART